MMNFFAAVAVQASEAASKLHFEPVNFIRNLRYMGIGMLVIFVVIGIIILSTVLINNLFSRP